MPAVKTSDVSCCRRRYVLIRRRSSAGSTGGYVAGTSVAYENQALQSNLVNTDTEGGGGGGGGGIESVRIKRVEFRENKVSVSSGCP